MSDPSAAAPQFLVVDLSPTFGAILASIFIALGFYGMHCLQMFIYFVNYPKDNVFLKLIVATLFLLDTTHKVLICAGIWQYLVSHFGDFANIASLHVPLVLQTLFTTIVAVIVQSFFTWRIWSLSGKKWIFPIIMFPAALAQTILVIFYNVNALSTPTVAHLATLSVYSYSINGIAAGVDVVIAILMCAFLAMGRSGFNKNTDRIISRLMVISVNTGFWTAVFGLTVVILSKASPNTLVYSCTYFPICSLYCNSLLASLNARDFVKSSYQSQTVTAGATLPMNKFTNVTSPTVRPGGTSVTANSFNVNVETSKYSHFDFDGKDSMFESTSTKY